MAMGRGAALGSFVFVGARLLHADVRVCRRRTSRCSPSRRTRTRPSRCIYKITGVWGNHEGSMVLWILILGALFGRDCDDAADRAGIRHASGFARARRAGAGRDRVPALHPAHLRSVRASITRRRSKAQASIRCCRIPASRSIRRCSISAMSVFRPRSRLPRLRCSIRETMRRGCAPRARSRSSPGPR